MKIKSPYILLLLIMIMPAGSSADSDAALFTMLRTHDPVQVPGSLLGEFEGTPLDSMRVFACRNGSWGQIVFQFDERLADGMYVFEAGKVVNLDQADKQLGSRDMLLFSVGDTGPQVMRKDWPSRDGIEIEITDPLDGGRSYCYLFRFSEQAPPRLEHKPMKLAHWDYWEQSEHPLKITSSSYVIEGMTNIIRGRVYKSALNKSILVPSAAGGSGLNFIDGIRARIYVELLFGQVRFDFNEGNLIGGMDMVRLGSVRGYGPQWLTLALPLGIPGPRVNFDLFTYEDMIVAPLTLNVPFDPKHLITRAGIQFGYDLNEHAAGMRFYSPNCMEGVTIDGLMSQQEKNMSDDWVPWYVITGPQGTMIWRAHLDESLMKQTTNHFFYTDDRSVSLPPEKLPGCMGYTRINVDISSVRPGTYPFRFEWYFPPHFYDPDGLNRGLLEEYLNILDAPLIVRVGARSSENRPLSPPPLLPDGL